MLGFFISSAFCRVFFLLLQDEIGGYPGNAAGSEEHFSGTPALIAASHSAGSMMLIKRPKNFHDSGMYHI
jgi:hypothetical protein